jgi:serine/threonine protein kinase
MDYCESGDLAHYISYNFFNISWEDKLRKLYDMTIGLSNIQRSKIIHKDFHSGNIFISYYSEAIIGDLGLSKSSLNYYEEDNGVYGIIPYVAPEVLQGQKYSKASDIYSFGMIMWELMTGRRPFWDRNHDTELIIEICDGLRPPIVTDAPEGYIELMQKCWHPDPNKRPTVDDISSVFVSSGKLYYKKEDNKLTINLESPDIGPITNNPGAIYKSRSLSAMIKSAESTRSLRISNRNTTLFIDKRKLYDDDNDKKGIINIIYYNF